MLRESDPGYYLIARGRRSFEKELGCRVPLSTRFFRLNSDLGVMSYVGMIACVTAIVLALVLLAVAHVGIGDWAFLVLAIVGFVPASDAAVALVNRVITGQVGGMLLPGLELRNGIPRELRTCVVVHKEMKLWAKRCSQVEATRPSSQSAIASSSGSRKNWRAEPMRSLGRFPQ